MTYINLPPSGAGTVTIDPGTVIGVTGTFWQATQPVSIATLPALSTGANVIGSIANTDFNVSQSGTWNVGIIGSPSVTVANSSIPVTGTFWQATQPVSFGPIPTGANVIGSIANTSFTANAGTNLNTSALALESGGNLEAVKLRLPTSLGPKVSTQSLSITPGTDATFILGAGSATIGTVNVAGTVAVTLPSAPLTNTELRATPVPIVIGTGSSAIGSITNTGFTATQSGTWNVGLTGTPLVNLGTGGSALSQTNPAFTRLTDGTNPLGINSNPLYTTVTGSVAVTGTFWQATQPVSIATLPALATGANVIGSIANTGFTATQSGTWNVGITGTPTVTANAGTNLNTSALALESGGNLASIATNTNFINGKFPSLGQALAAASIPVVLTAAQVTALTSPSAVGITNGSIDASILNLTNSNPLTTAIVDGSGNQIASFGGGTQYADGTATTASTGTVAMAFDGSRVRPLTIDNNNDLRVNDTSGTALLSRILNSLLPLTNTDSSQRTLQTIDSISAGVTLPTVTTVGTVTTCTTLTTLANGQTAHSSASTGSPVRIGGRVVPTTIATVDLTLAAGDASDAGITTGQQLVTKDFGTAELDINVAVTPTVTTTTVQGLVAASGTASVRNYITQLTVSSDTLGAAGTMYILDNQGAIGTSVTIATPGVFTSAAHDLKIGDTIIFTAIGTITGISVNTLYYVTATTFAATTFTIALTPGGTAIQITGSTSAFTFYRVLQLVRLQTTALATPVVITPPNPLRGIANSNLNVYFPVSLTSGVVYINVIGYRGF